ncbi:ras-associating and dilute domain-containing protein isoform X2 [Carettochelys insculpta]|uniref:ras-associating and dilute domain-containing protein isoform X2 n=1 Tax=Carettochelys insculpta TaxID=44489 RepID=UPI003EC1571F
MTTSHAMFYGSSSTMAPPSKNKLKRQSRIFPQVLYRTLSYKDRRSVSAFPVAGSDDPAELSTQVSAPGILKIFGGNICAGTHYKSVLATGSSSARELAKEALERYGLSKVDASCYVLCDVIGMFSGSEKQWQTEGLRVLGDHEKPLLIQDLWKPREGFSRRLELRKRSEVEELAARDVDTITAGVNAQARKLQRNRAKGTMTLLAGCKQRSSPPTLRRSVSETSLSPAVSPEEEPRRHFATLPESVCGLESSRDEQQASGVEQNGSSMRYSLYQSPHLLLLQGYSYQHDSLVYLLNCGQHTVGQRTQSSKPSISLFAPDILPLHCTLRRLKLPSRSRHRSEEKLILEPIPGASVSVNFSEVGRTVVLQHGDLLSLGLYYLLLYKDPRKAQLLPAQTLMRLKLMQRASDPEAALTCKMCGSQLRERGPSSKKHGPSPTPGCRPARKRLQLEFERAAEDVLVRRIMTLIEPGGDDHKLTPAFLLCLCIQHSATSFEPGAFGQLLLKSAKMIQRTVWEKTKELAEKQSQQQDPGSLSRFTVTDLLPDLQHVLFWMSNSIELLYFIQQKSPVYIQSLEEELDANGSKESLFSSTITASEEAMTVLEEVVMYTFQQCVYYISKATLDLLHQYEVHPEIASQMFAYLFFFSNTLLFNQLLDKGATLGCFQWAKGVKIRASLRLLLEWVRDVGFGQLAEQFFSKLSSLAYLLAMPSSQLAQMTWPLLRAEVPALSPAQLHHVLTQYQAASDGGAVTAWQPWQEDVPAAFRTEDVLESFDNHPPIVLPSGGFKVDLEVEPLDDNIYRHLLYIRHFLWSLRSRSPHATSVLEAEALQNAAPTKPNALEVPGNVLPVPALGNSLAQQDYRRPGSCTEADGSTPHPPARSRSPSTYYPSEPQLPEKLKQLPLHSSLGKTHLAKASLLQVDASCLLTPPNTPLNCDPGSPESHQSPSCAKATQDPQRDGVNGTKATTPAACSPLPYDYPTPASSSRSSATDDFCYVFVVELEKGPIGLGMGLIDGLHTPLNAPGIYIRTLIQDSPAASDGRLSLGDRILAVNGASLIGADYQSAVELIRSGGKKLRFLVAKSDMEIAKKISSSSS